MDEIIVVINSIAISYESQKLNQQARGRMQENLRIESSITSDSVLI
jgi:hypothetical protein